MWQYHVFKQKKQPQKWAWCRPGPSYLVRTDSSLWKISRAASEHMCGVGYLDPWVCSIDKSRVFTVKAMWKLIDVDTFYLASDEVGRINLLAKKGWNQYIEIIVEDWAPTDVSSDIRGLDSHLHDVISYIMSFLSQHRRGWCIIFFIFLWIICRGTKFTGNWFGHYHMDFGQMVREKFIN